MMNQLKLESFVEKIKSAPASIEFEDTMAVIERFYEFTPTTFKNGELTNEAGENSGSCKLFAFARLQELDEQQTLYCFGRYYRDDVLQHPEADDHPNIRNFLRSGWDGIHFEAMPLKMKEN